MKKKILFALSLLFGPMFINAGLNKLFNYMPVPDDLPEDLVKSAMAFMEIGWLMPLIAVAEIIGGVLFITNKYRALGALIIFPVMVGILLNDITTASSGLPVALALFAVLVWAIVENRGKYVPLIR